MKVPAFEQPLFSCFSITYESRIWRITQRTRRMEEDSSWVTRVNACRVRYIGEGVFRSWISRRFDERRGVSRTLEEISACR